MNDPIRPNAKFKIARDFNTWDGKTYRRYWVGDSLVILSVYSSPKTDSSGRPMNRRSTLVKIKYNDGHESIEDRALIKTWINKGRIKVEESMNKAQLFLSLIDIKEGRSQG